MEVVKYDHLEENNGRVDLYFKLCDRLADYTRYWTDHDDEDLIYYLDEENLFRYTISKSDDFDSILQSLIETIEKISNEYDDAYLNNHILTDNGHPRSHEEIHALMHSQYGLVDINKVENENIDNRDVDLEWWTANFFSALVHIIYEEPDELFEPDNEDDIENNMVHIA